MSNEALEAYFSLFGLHCCDFFFANIQNNVRTEKVNTVYAKVIMRWFSLVVAISFFKRLNNAI